MPVQTIMTTAGLVALKGQWDTFASGIDPGRGPWVRIDYVVEPASVANATINALLGAGVGAPSQVCPVSSNLRAIQAEAKGVGDELTTSGLPDFGLAVIAVTYGVPTWDQATTDDPGGANGFPNDDAPGTPRLYLEQSMEFGSELVKVPRTVMRFADNLSTGTPSFRSVGIIDFTVVKHWATALPVVDFTTYINSINDRVFLGQPRGQIMFRKGRTRRRAMTDGTRAQEVEMVFRWREFDHNKQHRPDEASFAFVFDGASGAGNKTYTYRDLRNLLTYSG